VTTTTTQAGLADALSHARFTLEGARWSWTVLRGSGQDEASIGWAGMTFSVGGVAPEVVGQSPETQSDNRQRTVTLTTRYAGLALVETLRFTIDEAQRELVIDRDWVAEAAVSAEAIREGMLDERGQVLTWGPQADLRLVHGDHLRTERFPESRPEYPYVRPLPTERRRYNAGEANVIPWLCLTDERYTSGLAAGALHDTPLRQVMHVQAPTAMTQRGLTTWFCEATPIGAASVELDAGDTLHVSTTCYQLLDGAEPQRAMQPYLEAYARRHERCGERSRMRTGACYCTWNYAREGDVHHDPLIERAKIIAERFPAAHHYLLDDGYQKQQTVVMNGFYPDPEANVDPAKFPRGLKAFADDIRGLGLQPGIWLSPVISLEGQLAEERPDWLLRDTTGDVFRLGKRGYVDLSVDAARSWVDRVLTFLYDTCGFEGCKLDFQSQMFDSERARYRRGTGRQWRDWFYGRIRELIGPEGFFETCIAMSMGDPHLSRFCDGYRLGADVSPFNWQRHVDSSRWALPALAVPGNRFALLNMDSFGWDRDTDEAINRFRADWCLITQGLLEFGGELETFDDDVLDFYAKVLRHPDRGHGCRVIDEQAYTGLPFPRVIVVDYPEGSLTRERGIRQHVALFNWSDHAQMIGAAHEQLGVEPAAERRDFWTDQPWPTDEAGVFARLEARSSRLIEVG